MVDRGTDQRTQPTPSTASVIQRPTYDFSRAVREDGRSLNGARVATHRTRFLLFRGVPNSTIRVTGQTALTQINCMPWRCDHGNQTDAASGRRLPASDQGIGARAA